MKHKNGGGAATGAGDLMARFTAVSCSCLMLLAGCAVGPPPSPTQYEMLVKINEHVYRQPASSLGQCVEAATKITQTRVLCHRYGGREKELWLNQKGEQIK